MTDKLPPNLLALFQPRPPLRYLPQVDHAPGERKTCPVSGVAGYLDAFKEYEGVSYEPTESWLQRRDRVKAERREKQAALHGPGFEKCTLAKVECFLRPCLPLRPVNPSEDPQIRGDAFKTLFVARLSYDAKENDLEKEFGRYGTIERVSISICCLGMNR